MIVFGQDRHVIRSDACEERFGLRVILNSVNPKSLGAVDVSTLGANPFNGTRQASQEASLGEFGINRPIDCRSGSPVTTAYRRRSRRSNKLS